MAFENADFYNPGRSRRVIRDTRIAMSSLEGSTCAVERSMSSAAWKREQRVKTDECGGSASFR